MSWFARSIASSLKFEDDDQQNDNALQLDSKSSPSNPKSDEQSPTTTPRGVKEDLSELTQTLNRQFWGVASFLAPPPDQSHQSEPPKPSDQPDSEDEDLLKGIRSDFAEIGERFKSGISKLSTNIGVSEISKLASTFLQIGEEGYIRDGDLVGNVVGVTDEVVAFARDIAMHPETWLDFPVPPDDEDFEDFELSDAQQEHALTVEHLAPRLAALRLELCPQFMSEGCFWKIYLVLVHPRLDKDAAEILSTPLIVGARAALSHELQSPNRELPKPDQSVPSENILQESTRMPSLSEPEPVAMKTSDVEVAHPTVSSMTAQSDMASAGLAVQSETEKHPVQSIEVQFIDKAVVEEPTNKTKSQSIPSSSSGIVEEKFQDDDDWLEEESSETIGATGSTVPIEDDEDVSFSDLEDDDDDADVPINYKTVETNYSSSTKEDSQGCLTTNRSSGRDVDTVSVKQSGLEQAGARNSVSEESSGWLDVDDIDAI